MKTSFQTDILCFSAVGDGRNSAEPNRTKVSGPEETDGHKFEKQVSKLLAGGKEKDYIMDLFQFAEENSVYFEESVPDTEAEEVITYGG